MNSLERQDKSRVLALDPGTKRIGVALSDELRWFAQPLETYERQSLTVDVAHIQELIQRHDVSQVLLGLPMHMDGKIAGQPPEMVAFREQLEQSLSIPLIPWDERLTSRAAEHLLIEANLSRRKRKTVIDRVAAAILLQSYLDHLSTQESSVSTEVPF